MASAKSAHLQEQLDSAREQCHELEGQLQKREVALTASQGKIDLLTAEAQTSVSTIYRGFDKGCLVGGYVHTCTIQCRLTEEPPNKGHIGSNTMYCIA